MSLISTKIADLLLSPKTTLPALLNYAGVPPFIAQLLVPIRESGSLLPQMVFARMLKNYSARHKIWRLGAVLQVLMSVGMLYSALDLSGIVAGIAIVTSLVVWSFSRSLCSLISKDIQGEHIKEGERGKLIGAAGTISSIVSICVAITAWLTDILCTQMGSEKLLVIGCLAILIQAISLLIMWPVRVDVSVSENNKGHNKALFTLSKNLKHFIVVRSLFSHSALLAPFFTLAYSGETLKILAFLIIAQASGGFVSSYIWGSVADKSAVYAMRLGGCLALSSSILLLASMLFYDQLLANSWFVVALFFILSLGHNGVRTGRKIYSVDIAKDHDRTEFVAVSNTLVGSFILVAGLTYSWVSVHYINAAVLIMTLALAGAIGLSFTLNKEK